MKKYVLSILLVVAVFVGGVAYGDTISLIGKKVQKQSDIFLDGVKIDDIIIVDGKSYAPVRSLAEAVGVKVDFKEGKVILTSETITETNGDKPLTKQQLLYKLDSLETEQTFYVNKINSLKETLKGLEKFVQQYKALIDKGIDVKENTEFANYYENGIKENLAEQAKLESELKSLNETIKDIKDQISKL